MKTTASTERPAPQTVLLHLTRGISTQNTWLLRAEKSAATVTIGSDASCDWQIEGKDVPSHALSVALFDGGFFVAAGPEADVELAGEPLAEVWQRVDRAQTIALGDAELELEIAWLPAAKPELRSERDRPTFPDGVSAGDARGSYAPRSSWVERFSRTSWLDSPSLLGRSSESRTSSQLLRYAGLVLFTALAYRAWLLLLDRI